MVIQIPLEYPRKITAQSLQNAIESRRIEIIHSSVEWNQDYEFHLQVWTSGTPDKFNTCKRKIFKNC